MTEIKKYKMLINGNWTSGSENKFFESLNPYTGEYGQAYQLQV